MKKLFIFLLIFILLFSSCNFNKGDGDKSYQNERFIGVWFTYKEIEELCGKSNTEDELKVNINKIIIKLKRFKVNNIFLHVRAFDDCFYKSTIFKASNYCSDKDGNLKFDILDCFNDVAKEMNISVHAWLNPYRIRNDNHVDKILNNSYAWNLLTNNPNDERIIITDNSIFYNPAYPEVQNYVLSAVREIIENHKVDGIHIDDYFYPTQNENIDNIIYTDYLKSGGSLNIADFRRNAVNSLISSIYSLVKSYDNDIIVSISPSADIKKNYNDLYADVEFWAKNTGYVDILIPQIYYGFNHSTMSFDKVLNEWMSMQNENIKIVIGLAVYKSGNIDKYAGDGINEWIDNNDILSKQIISIENFNAYGWSYFSTSYLIDEENTNLLKEKDNIIDTLVNIGKIM